MTAPQNGVTSHIANQDQSDWWSYGWTILCEINLLNAIVLKGYCLYYLFNVNIICTPYKISQYFSIKDPIPNMLKSCVVYKFTCGGCNTTAFG